MTTATTSPRTPTPKTPDADLAGRLRLAVMRLGRRLRQESATDVTPSQLSTLATISRLEPVTLGRLAAAERVRPPTVTRVVGSLEDVGLVERERDSVDGRVWHVSLTTRGHRHLAQIRRRRDRFLGRRLANLTAEERATLWSAAGILERLAGEES